MRRWLIAAVVLAAGCMSSAERRHMARLEARVQLLESQAARSRTAELMLSESVGRLKERLAVLKRELDRSPMAGPRSEPDRHADSAETPSASRQPGQALPSSPGTPSPEQLTRLWRRTGELLDRLHGRGGPSELRGLIDQYLEINIHGGLINENLRRRYYATLERIHGRATEISERRKP